MDDIHDLLSDAAELEVNGQFDEALVLYQSALDLKPDHPFSLFRIADLTHQSGNGSGAESLINKAVNLEPHNGEFLYLQGCIMRSNGRNDAAQRAWHSAIEAEPDHVPARIALAEALAKQGRQVSATELLKAALLIDPHSPTALLQLGVNHHQLGEVQDARASLETLTKKHPYLPGAHNALGNVLFDLGEYESAIECYRKGLVYEIDNATIHFNLAKALEKSGHPQDAIKHYMKAIQHKPNYFTADVHLANLRLRQNNFESAIESYEKLLLNNPSNGQIRLNLGISLSRLGHVDESLVHFALAAEFLKGDAESLLRLAQALIDIAQLELAEIATLDAIDANSQFPAAHRLLSQIYFMQGKLEEAWKTFEWRLKASSSWPNAQIFQHMVTLQSLESHMHATVLRETTELEEIVCGSMIPDLIKKVEDVTLYCSAGLKPIFTRSFPQARIEAKSRNENVPAKNSTAIPAASLGKFLRTSRHQFQRQPYLLSDSTKVEQYRQVFASNDAPFRVGICWKPDRELIESEHYPELWQWQPILSQRHIQFVGLFTNDSGDQLKDARNLTHYQIIEPPTYSAEDQLDELLAQISALDLVISVNGKIAHLAAASGKETWVLAQTSPAWYWLDDEDDSMWYPHMKLFRPTRTQQWEAVLNNIGEALAQRGSSNSD